ncbi:MAG: PAS domain S-box protein [Polyangiaceae bacterium]
MAANGDHLNRLVVESSPLGVVVLAPRLQRLVFATPAMRGLSGYTVDELLELPPHPLERLIHEDDRQRLADDVAALLAGAEALQRAEVRFLRKDGGVVWVESFAAVVEADGEPAVLLAFADVTRRRETEQRLAAAQRLAQLGDWYWDVRTGDVQWSEEVFKIFRLDPETFTPQIDSILALSPWPEDNQRDQELIQRAVESREPGSYEQRFLRPDGSIGYYASTFQGIYDEAGELTAMQGTVQDITERKQAEEERARLEDQLRHAQKMESIGRLAGGIAHDFNNMLCAIMGQVALAKREPALSESLQQSLAEIGEAAERAANLTRQLLAFSRKQVLAPRVLDLGELIADLDSMLRRLIGEDIELRTVPEPELGLVRVDPTLMEQIVLNLAVNARDAMIDGGELLIETANVELDESYCERHADVRPGSYVMLAVSDTGVGIPEDVRDKIFEPFFTTKQLGRGTGLGLATVYGIVRQNEGRIEVYSEPGRGTSFKIYFPRVFEPADARPRRASLPDRVGTETVLVVEDDEMVRRLAERLLRRGGYTVIVAGSGAEALEVSAAHERAIDLLLTDVVMPGMNGRELARRLVAERPGLRVLFTSGYTDNVIAHHGVLDPGVHFLAKPYSLDALMSLVRQILDEPPPGAGSSGR